MEIRNECRDDVREIHDLTVRAFTGMPHSSGTEAQIVDALRTNGDLTVSLVALVGQRIVGHIAFSPVTIDDEFSGWYGLGPVSVAPAFQSTGIGSALINEGLSKLKAFGARGCVLVGDPNYYSRFGFVSDGLLAYQDVPDCYVQWLSFDDATAAGRLGYSPAFGR